MKILDKILYKRFKGLSLSTATKATHNEWHCVLEDGDFLAVGTKGGVLSMSRAAREYDGGKDVAVVASIAPILMDVKVTFNEVVEFMEWTISEDNVWDNDC